MLMASLQKLDWVYLLRSPLVTISHNKIRTKYVIGIHDFLQILVEKLSDANPSMILENAVDYHITKIFAKFWQKTRWTTISFHFYSIYIKFELFYFYKDESRSNTFFSLLQKFLVLFSLRSKFINLKKSSKLWYLTPSLYLTSLTNHFYNNIYFILIWNNLKV